MMMNLPPQQQGKYSPLGVSRDDCPEMTDDEYVRYLCEQAVLRRSPAAGF
jgi:hypothetical protein